MILAPAAHQLLLYAPSAQHWSLLHTHLMHLLELGLGWRVLVVLRALRRDDLRERRDPLSQQRGRR